MVLPVLLQALQATGVIQKKMTVTSIIKDHSNTIRIYHSMKVLLNTFENWVEFVYSEIFYLKDISTTYVS